MFVELIVEPPERSPPLERLGQASAGGAVADAVSKVGHVLVPHVGGERVDGNEIQLVDLDGVSPSMPVSLVQNATSPVPGSINHRRSQSV